MLRVVEFKRVLDVIVLEFLHIVPVLFRHSQYLIYNVQVAAHVYLIVIAVTVRVIVHVTVATRVCPKWFVFAFIRRHFVVQRVRQDFRGENRIKYNRQ